MFHVGIILVVISILAGFVLEGGNVYILFQPYATLIIVGTALGIFITSNPKTLLRSLWKNVFKIHHGSPYRREDYLEMLTFMYYFFKYVKSKGFISVEKDIETPSKSPIFREFPKFLMQREAVIFFCDYMRLGVLGYEKSAEMEQLIEDQLQVKKNYIRELSLALFRLADALPAVGIMAAVLGVINAMSSINAEPAVLGHKIGAALMGTFIGITISYCLIFPLSSYLEKYGADEVRFLEAMKSGFLSFIKGNHPTIAVEFARQMIPANFKPSFVELEKAIEKHKINRKIAKNVRRETATVTG